MEVNEVVQFLSEQTPKDILCLGMRGWGVLSDVLNRLESDYPEKFNKRTVYASISDRDSSGNVEPKRGSAIFTSFDGSKGLERKICVVFDFTVSYWVRRIRWSQQPYEILRNIFCVAASRGKEHIIFVKHDDEMLSKEILSTKVETNKFRPVDISKMFHFKFKESIEECYNLLDITPLNQMDLSNIYIKNKDENIDLSPCIGIYQEAVYFDNYNIDEDIELFLEFNPQKRFLYTEQVKQSSLENKILFLTSLETKQDRYITQVDTPFVPPAEGKRLSERLSSMFRKDENVQVRCSIDFPDDSGKHLFYASGLADVVKDNVVYELKFVSELTHEHFLQCASYVVALNLEKGVLWNTRNNMMYEITVPNKAEFLNAVARTVTKDYLKGYNAQKMENKIAVIDTETNWDNEVMSIGIVVADAHTYEPVDYKYFVLEAEAEVGGMYSSSLRIDKKYSTINCSRSEAIAAINAFLKEHGVKSVFAYNARFDFGCLIELAAYDWYDIMGIAAYKQYNPKIPQNAECFKTGRLKRNYGVEAIMRILSDDDGYSETHNALFDALDELKIMKLLGHGLKTYDCAAIKNSKISSPDNFTKVKSGDDSQKAMSGESFQKNISDCASQQIRIDDNFQEVINDKDGQEIISECASQQTQNDGNFKEAENYDDSRENISVNREAENVSSNECHAPVQVSEEKSLRHKLKNIWNRLIGRKD